MPLSPGVYWFLDGDGNVLYVGKAKNLKNRLRQYAKQEDERPQIAVLLTVISRVEWQELPSELDALLIEAELIRRYQPHYNILLKDDKSNLYICIGSGDYPTVFTARKPEIIRSHERWTVFGPFQSGYKVRQVLEIARRIFQWCDHPGSKRPCFYTHLGLCSGACIGQISPIDYQTMIANLKLFLRGKTGELIRECKQSISHYSEKKEYEKAQRIKEQVEAILTVTSPKYRLRPDMTIPVLTTNLEEEALISLRAILREYCSLPATTPLQRIEGYDISNTSGTHPTCSMVTAINGSMDHREYKHFGIKSLQTPNDYAMLREALTRRQNHPEWGIPDVILIDGGKGQLQSVLSVWKWPSLVISIAKRPDRLFIPLRTAPSKGTKQPTLRYKEIELTPSIPASRLLQSIRDEAHRFAKRLHSKKRTQGLFES